jgi:hypothetical protein
VKVLLDEDLPHKPRTHIPNHDVRIVAYMGWSGVQNGELLSKCEDQGFEVFVTGDKKMSYQKNIKGRQFGVVVLSTLDWEIMKPYLDNIVAAVDAAVPGSVQNVDCGEFKR